MEQKEKNSEISSEEKNDFPTPERYAELSELETCITGLCGMMSVSGFGHRATSLLSESQLKQHFDEITTDAVGNLLLVKKCGKADAPRILIDTHFDEIGFLVREVLDGGFLRFTTIGGIDLSILQATDVRIYGDKTYHGVIISTPPHLRKGDAGTLPDAEDLLIDTGFDLPADELRKKIPEGTAVGFAPLYSVLGEVPGETASPAYHRLAGKSFDNKACAAVALWAICHTKKEELTGDVTLLLANFEETNRLGGVVSGAYAANPDYAMVIDVNLAAVPDTPSYETVGFEKGISLSLSSATDRHLTDMTKELCEKKEIAFTLVAAPSSTGTDAASLQLVRNGIPVVDVGLPLKNMHTPNEVISMKDADALEKAVRAFVTCPEIADTFGHKKEVKVW